MDAKQLNEALIKQKLLSLDQITALEQEKFQAKGVVAWEDFLVDKKILQEKELLSVKSELLKVPIVDLQNLEIKQEVLNLVPEPIAHRHKVISFQKDSESLSLAMVDPEDLQTREFIKKKTGLNIKTFLIGRASLDFGLSKYHTSLEKEINHLFKPTEKPLTEGAKPIGESADDSLKKMAEEIPVIRVVDTLLEYAIFEKASDIHIEPQENSVVVRYRIDGVLHDVMTLPKVIQAAIVARIKVLSNLKIDEHRLPQDGRFKVEKEGLKFSLRISTIPIFDGEKVVIRLLQESSKVASLDDLGFRASNSEVILRSIKKPHGMLLVTGPTGSGKSTTLYTVLSILNTKSVNISTIEDPVEYRVVGANQMQVNPKIGLTFAMGLRALLRQDPNVIMIGEIRDKETAEEAVHAAMTGHVVFSTLHTNNSAGALPRLLDIGVEPYLIASTVNAVLAQRLVRSICPECKTEYKLDSANIEALSKEFHLEKLISILTEQTESLKLQYLERTKEYAIKYFENMI
jgi:type IV pilus assembly protein PilB